MHVSFFTGMLQIFTLQVHFCSFNIVQYSRAYCKVEQNYFLCNESLHIPIKCKWEFLKCGLLMLDQILDLSFPVLQDYFKLYIKRLHKSKSWCEILQINLFLEIFLTTCALQNTLVCLIMFHTMFPYNVLFWKFAVKSLKVIVLSTLKNEVSESYLSGCVS